MARCSTIRERTIAEGTTPAEYGRREAFTVHKILKEKGPGHRAARVRVHGSCRPSGSAGCSCISTPGSIGTSCSTQTIENFDLDEVSQRQKTTFAEVGLPLPVAGR